MKPSNVLKNHKVDLSKWDMGDWPERLGCTEKDAKKQLKDAIDDALISIKLEPTDEQLREVLVEAIKDYFEHGLYFCLSEKGLVIIPDGSKLSDPKIIVPFEDMGLYIEDEEDTAPLCDAIKKWLDGESIKYWLGAGKNDCSN